MNHHIWLYFGEDGNEEGERSDVSVVVVCSILSVAGCVEVQHRDFGVVAFEEERDNVGA